MRFFELNKSRDPSGVPALFTDDAVFIGGAPCNVTTFCKGPAAISERIKNAAAAHSTQTLIGTPLVAGNLVFLRWESRADADQKVGIERHISMGNVVVLGDKIAAWVAQDDLSDAQTIKFQLYQQAQASSSTAATTDPATVARRYAEAINGGDASAAAAVYATNAVVIAGAPCGIRTPCTTGADILKATQNSVALHTNSTPIGEILAAGNLAEPRSETRNAAGQRAGVERFIDISTYAVVGDKAVGRITLSDLSDAETLKFQLFQQAQANAAASSAKPAASQPAKPSAG